LPKEDSKLDLVKSINSKHWGGLLRDFTLSSQGCDLISFDRGKEKWVVEGGMLLKEKNIHSLTFSLKRQTHNASLMQLWSFHASGQCPKQYS
jgi:hypothetical protein